MDEIEPTVTHCFTGAGMAKPRVHLSRDLRLTAMDLPMYLVEELLDRLDPSSRHLHSVRMVLQRCRRACARMHESEDPMEWSDPEAPTEYLKRHPSEMPRKPVDCGVLLGNSMSGTEVGAAVVKDAHHPCIDAGEVLPSSEAKGEVKAAVFSDIVPPTDPCELILSSKVLNVGRIKTPGEESFEDLTRRNCFLGRKVSDEDVVACVDASNQYQAGLVGYERGRPGALKNMHGTCKRGILSTVATLICFASTLQVQAVGAIAPETATHGFMQAGNSKVDTSWSFWFGVVACIAALFTIIAAIVAAMQLRQSRRNQTVTAPMKQMLTMQRRSRVQYIIVEEETVHLIDDMV